jgi:FkbH-like protein
MEFSQLKLIIWDLDETFWEGILSEGEIQPIQRTIKLVRDLTDRGIINTICSKNDVELVEKKLKELGCDDLFVFKSIDWTPKGQRIASLIQEMGLQSKHCLFIDDNPVNLREAIYYSPDIVVAEPSIIDELIYFVDSIPISDPFHKRLEEYRVLERKQQARVSASNNLEFLYDSDTQVRIKHDCLNHIDRIFELVNRTNQLNYTKVRSTKEELENLCRDKSIETGYVEVFDKFGDYGIVGFYAVLNHQCLHFLFSCRTIGQGVEQYVYAYLGYPDLKVVGDVVNSVSREASPAWINQKRVKSPIRTAPQLHNKIVLKGACDLKVMSEYLQTDTIIEEFTYTGLTRGNLIEHQNHSINYLQWPFLSETIKNELVEECVFNDKEMFKTAIYENDISIIFLSTMIEPNLGIYRRKKDDLKIAFGECSYPLTNSDNWDLYINGKIFNARNTFTIEWLAWFRDNYVFEGSLSANQILDNAKELLKRVSPNSRVCYILGSEIPFEMNTQKNYEDRHLVYKEINQLFRAYAANDDRMLLIDVNDFLRGQQDFTNNINHFQRRVYYEIATKANEYIKVSLNSRLKQKNRLYLYWRVLSDRLGNTGFYKTRLWKNLRKPYIFIKEKWLQ